MTTRIDHRRNARLAVTIDVGKIVSHTYHGGVETAQITNLSPEGAFLDSRLRFKQGEILRLPELNLPDGSKMENLYSQVVRVSEDFPGRAGLRFLFFQEEEKRKLQHYFYRKEQEEQDGLTGC